MDGTISRAVLEHQMRIAAASPEAASPQDGDGRRLPPRPIWYGDDDEASAQNMLAMRQLNQFSEMKAT